MGRPRLLKSRELSAVPVARYFVVVGSVLTVLLLIAGWSLPEPPPIFPDRPEIIDRATIRIRSERKWPEKVVLDTSQPTITPPSTEVSPAQQLAESQPDGRRDQTRADSLARPNPDAQPIHADRAPTRAKHRTRRLPTTHVARVRIRSEQVTLGTREECCRFARADGPAISKTASRKRVARRDTWIGWHFPEEN
jgi:hypothetical protein